MSQNLLAIFKSARLSEKVFVVSKLKNLVERSGVVLSYAMVSLTNNHLFIKTTCENFQVKNIGV